VETIFKFGPRLRQAFSCPGISGALWIAVAEDE